MERKAKNGGERERERRKARGGGGGGGPGATPSAPPPPCAVEDLTIVVPSPSTPPSGMEDSPSFPAALRCARALLMLSSLRSPSPSPGKEVSETEELGKGDLEGTFAAVGASLKAAEGELAEMSRRMEKLWRVVRIAVALQVLLGIVFCTVFYSVLAADCPSSSNYYG